MTKIVFVVVGCVSALIVNIFEPKGVCEPKYRYENRIAIIDDTHDPCWQYYPNIKTKIVVGGQTYHLNYQEYWYDFLLCDPAPTQKLDIISFVE